MVKILKPDNKDPKFQLTCPFCTCEFVYEKEDLDSDRFIKCPDCGVIIDHDFYQRKRFDLDMQVRSI